ncbi:MAG: hypothetical protein JKX88_01315 [Marinicaulis sp.]|nr:hypothetical protein [Marinicaulis sp.]
MNISFDPLAPLWVLGLFILVGAIFAGLSIWRNWRSGLLRALAIAALLGLLINPQWREAEETPLDDIVLVLSDLSASQSLDQRDAVTTSAVKQLTEKLESLENIEIRLHEFSGEEQTRTVEALRTALADAPRSRLGGVFIITDGQSADAEDAEAALGLDAPVHLLVTGKRNEVDRKITLINAPRYGIVRQSVRVSFRIDDLGNDEIPLEATGSAMVVLRVDGEEILRQPVPFGEEVGFDAPLNRPGRTVIELEVEARSGELTERNNVVVLPITAIRDRLRVLLISGEPHPGERVWRNLLKSDPAVDLVHFTILRPIDKNESAPISELALIPFPQDELFIEKLSEFDLLIFDRYTYRGVLSSFHFDNIARFVDQGGAVLISSGPEYNGSLSLASQQNLSFILPAIPIGGAIEKPFRPAVTELGDRHPVTAGLPEKSFWGRWLRTMPVLKLRGQTLMTGPDDTPLLILDRVGEGRIGLFLSDHVWLWARGFDGGGPHAELLRRIAHWLMKEPELEEEALSLHSDGDALVIERRTMANTPSTVMLTHPDGEQSDHDLIEVEPGKFAVRLENLPRGLYRAASDELFAIGEIGLAAAPEFIDVVSSRKKLAPLAENTGGGIFSIQRGDAAKLPSIRKIRGNTTTRVAEDWAGIVTRNDARLESVKEVPAAPPLLWLVLIGASLLAAWRIEGGKRRK